MRFAVEMFNSIGVEDAEWQAWIRVYFLRVLIFVGLFLDSFELPEQEYGGIFNSCFFPFFFGNRVLFLDDVCENSVINGEPIDIIELFDEFETHWAPDSSVPKFRVDYM